MLGWCPGAATVTQTMATYPGTQVIRLFRSSGQGLQSWNSGELGEVPDEVAIWYSWKDWPYDVSAWLDAMPTGRRNQVWLTLQHEPEQQSGGDPTPAQFKQNWEELVAALAAHPRRSWIRLAPIFTHYYADHHTWEEFWPADAAYGIDTVGWDVYNDSDTVYQSADSKLELILEVATATGKPYAIGEFGTERTTSDTTGAGAVTWMQDFVTRFRATGAQLACWFHVGGDDLIATNRQLEMEALQALIAGNDPGSVGGDTPPYTPPTDPTLPPLDSLALWDAELNQAAPATLFDWGSAARGSSADVQFRIRNRSASYSATAVTVAVADTGTAASPSVAVQHLLSVDGETFTAALALGDMPPGVSSAPLTLRRVTAPAAQLGTFTFRVSATAATWQ